jgi:hypothetical protein
MAYIGTSPSNGVRRVHTYTATANQTTFTGSSTEGVTLTYADTNYIDVFQNGVLLGSVDYTSTSGTSVVLAQGASVSDLVVIVVYDVFSVADTVSKTAGGSFDSAVTFDGDVTIGDASAADKKILFDGNAQDFHIGLDDSADSLTIGLGSALGTTSHMVINATGAVTKPLQPAFLAQPASAQNNIAVNTLTDVAYGTERFDNNGDFASNTFTAPVTGKYQFNVSVILANLDSAATYYHIKFTTSNRIYHHLVDPDYGQDNAYRNLDVSVLADMDADDTAIVKVFQAAGTAQTDIDTASQFSGHLVC